MFALGLAAALVASALFNVGIALQGIEARSAPKQLGLRVSLLTSLFRRKRWVLGWLLGVVGIAPQLVAFAYAPFVVVQPALASGLLILLFIGSRLFGERVTWLEIAAVCAIIGGLALVAWGAPPHTEVHRSGAAVIAVVAGADRRRVLSVLRARHPLRHRHGVDRRVRGGLRGEQRRDEAPAPTTSASGHYVIAATWAAVGLISGIAATITGMTAFQRRPATTVVPVSTAVQTFLPIVLEPLFLREHWASATLDGAPIAIGLAARARRHDCRVTDARPSASCRRRRRV